MLGPLLEVPVKAKLAEKLDEAESTIFERLQKIGTKPSSEAERVALDDAIRGLHVLKRETCVPQAGPSELA